MHVLLLNYDYRIVNFITEQKAFKLLSNEKVIIEEYWDCDILHGDKGKIKLPSILRMKYIVRSVPRKLKFNRIAVFKRDQFCCQFCGIALTPSKLTLEHIVPKSKGGGNSWLNCTTACKNCNGAKSNLTLAECGMKLLSNPFIPKQMLTDELAAVKPIHPLWKNYLGID